MLMMEIVLEEINNIGEKREMQGPYSPTILKNILCLFLHDL